MSVVPAAVTESNVLILAQSVDRDNTDQDAGKAVGSHTPEQMELSEVTKGMVGAESSIEPATKVQGTSKALEISRSTPEAPPPSQ